CYLKLLRSLSNIFNLSSKEIKHLISDKNGNLKINLEHNRIKLNDKFYFSFRESFKEYWLSLSGLGSFTRTMIPDFSIYKKNKNNYQLLVFDSKYRVNTQLNEAISSIHTYRDAIVYDDFNKIKQTVIGSYLLTPQDFNTYKQDWKQEKMPNRIFHPYYKSKFKFGAITFKPGLTNFEIDLIIKHILQDSFYIKL
ncbi:MAG: hypothetical protein CL661_08695, partial [Bacteroidetes bacterium]|nr:hypothetical protein [Bacteroidota bacterium]